MAQVMSTGSYWASLYECENSLARVVSDLGLPPLSSSDEEDIRSTLGYIIGRGLARIAVTKKLNPQAKLQTKDIGGVLTTARQDPSGSGYPEIAWRLLARSPLCAGRCV
jgi:hypothetical protein